MNLTLATTSIEFGRLVPVMVNKSFPKGLISVFGEIELNDPETNEAAAVTLIAPYLTLTIGLWDPASTVTFEVST